MRGQRGGHGLVRQQPGVQDGRWLHEILLGQLSCGGDDERNRPCCDDVRSAVVGGMPHHAWHNPDRISEALLRSSIP